MVPFYYQVSFAELVLKLKELTFTKTRRFIQLCSMALVTLLSGELLRSAAVQTEQE